MKEQILDALREYPSGLRKIGKGVANSLFSAAQCGTH